MHEHVTVDKENSETGAFSTDTSGTDYYYAVLDTTVGTGSTTETSSSGTQSFDSNETGNRYLAKITLTQTGGNRYTILPVAVNNTSDG